MRHANPKAQKQIHLLITGMSALEATFAIHGASAGNDTFVCVFAVHYIFVLNLWCPYSLTLNGTHVFRFYTYG